MKKILTWIFLTSSTILSAQTSQELQQIDSILNNIWDNKKAGYINSLNNHVSGTKTTVLYNVQAQTNNLLRYAYNQNKYSVLNDLAEVYLAAHDKLDYLITKENSYCSVVFSEPQLAWTTGDSKETELNSAQFLYAIAKTVNYAVSIPSDTLNQYAELDSLINKYVPVLTSHYDRWLTSDSTFQVDGWPPCIDGCFTHQEFLELKLQQVLEDGSTNATYCNVVTDLDMWIIAGITELLAANHKSPTRVPLQMDLKVLFQDHVDLGTELIESRLSSTTLSDFNGSQVNGLVFDPGGWSTHADYQYAGITDSSCPPTPTSLVLGASWDISHARRWVHVFESLYNHRNVTGQSFPDLEVMQGLANQFLYEVFNGDLDYPLFSNYYDGTDGWYRFEYRERPGWGYAPYDLSITAITGGYCFWSKYNADFSQLRYALWEMTTSTEDSVITHIENYYGTHYDDCIRKEARDFDHTDAFSTSIDLLQFLPTFFPSGVAQLSHFDNLITSAKSGDSTYIFKSWSGNTLGHEIYGPSTYWDVVAMASGDFDDSGDKDLLTAFHATSKDAIYKSDNGCCPGTGNVYNSTTWDVIDMTTGDIDGDGNDELITAFHLPSEGKYAVYTNDSGSSPSATLVYLTFDKSIVALASGDFDGDDNDDEIIMAVDSLGYTQIYKSEDGSDMEEEILYPYNGTWSVTDITAGDFDGDGDDELVTAFRNSNLDAIYLSENGCCPRSGKVYESTFWQVGGMTVGDFDGNGNDELVTAFNSTNGGALYVSETGYSPASYRIYGPDPELVFTQLSAGQYSNSSSARVQTVTLIGEIKTSNQIVNLVPNPTTQTFKIIHDEKKSVSRIMIYNLNGKEVSFERSENIISIENALRGIYIIKVHFGDEVWNGRIMIK